MHVSEPGEPAETSSVPSHKETCERYRRRISSCGPSSSSNQQ
ncbi:hypothetical protein, unlikely [Trypanosoma brucei gambiense DAL972]|uniref:Uncharacterized protein n=1 Tax=Trypanosoma brucei gambiense (strain MHOM/CI/86/DAL972) TaxID=679716 RepID=C9ZHV4_TRYB9|nr:hypothetical protein, unlikely [Trypanosoma brucei gambiense DAL972]CBH08825.1 hypothetical protein, unlikely [Trypanosoma brucei gambiense DAL972]|eukprot:XP_011771266.1 hypothetical protein, unlikely [Trypanosoma brucei gambiense DAL972]